MSIILPEEKHDETEDQIPKVVNYQATEEDEERFFLIYHMNFQPSEAEILKPEYRQWLIARFLHQKRMEEEAMQRQHLMRQIGPTLKT